VARINIEVLGERMDNLKEIVTKGFAEVHKRQDLANGKLMKHDNKIAHMEAELDNINANFVDRAFFNKKIGEIKLSEELREKNMFGKALSFFTDKLLGPILVAVSIYLMIGK